MATMKQPNTYRDCTPRSQTGWGYEDTAFVYKNETEGLYLSGSRYVVSGQHLPSFVPFFEKVLGVPKMTPDRVRSLPSREDLCGLVGDCDLPPRVRELLSQGGFDWSMDPLDRLHHSHGHTQSEISALLTAGTQQWTPSAVVHPRSGDEIEALIKIATEHDIRFIPFGGGTNVSQSLTPEEGETRAVVTVNVSTHLKHIEWIDTVNCTAKVQAGIRGVELEQMLREHGMTCGHEPDSSEFSTLGGWIATRASGMKKNRYGNIEDIVIGVDWYNRDGACHFSHAHPRVSMKQDLKHVIMGSEGSSGIISAAVIRIRPLPEVVEYNSFLFKDFETGLAFLRSVQASELVPASIRLMDNLQLQFGRACKPADNSWYITKELQKRYLAWKGLAVDQMVLCTVVHEGLYERYLHESASLKELCTKYGGVCGGPGHGHAGYNLTYAIAYIRDFALRMDIYGESFETAVSWDKCVPMIDAVRDTVTREHARFGVAGTPFFTARVSQVYGSGVCVYFYYAVLGDGLDDPSHVYEQIETACRATILCNGGSLSHHHGVGRHRAKFMGQQLGDTAVATLDRMRCPMFSN